ncbi:tyrosine-type recombinase/integrase [Arthrobacter sp. CG_A4]|uniref:tyrosine-type recombinase/integrase n=1 Tax=Arthrobacter sp. CG_A4 TaxID=3071706 RepID=UPI002DFEFBF2|nr:integrase [Arthrobacter sp. CG_A4]
MGTMVREVGVAVVAALDAAGYMGSTIGQYRKSIRALERLAQKQGGVYTPGLGADFSAMTTSPRTGKFSAQRRFDYGRLVSLFDSYVLTGTVTLAARKRSGGGYGLQSGEFIALMTAWSDEMEQRGLAVATRGTYGRMARDYLVYLEAVGVTSLNVAGGASVFGFLDSLQGRWAQSAMWSVASSFRPFLKFTRRRDLLDAVGMANARRHHGIVPTLRDADEQLVVRACAEGKVSARDAAITLLALVTGLRACDLIALHLNDIDWRGFTIGIVQAKTGNPLTLPLLPMIAGKLADYVLNERPASGDAHVFLRSAAPHVALADHASIYVVATKMFRAAGVKDVKAGTRALRHNAASKLLRAGTPLPTISAVLGHASPDSTTVYLSMDAEHLRACVLPLPQGAVR